MVFLETDKISNRNHNLVKDCIVMCDPIDFHNDAAYKDTIINMAIILVFFISTSKMTLHV